MTRGMTPLALLLALLTSGSALAAGAVAEHAMVATDHELASGAAVEMLRSGGNAIDAAIAAAFVLGVVNPQSSGLGGGGFLVYYDAGQRRAYALEYRDRAPAGTAALLRSGQEKPFRFGGLAAAVPCEAIGLEAARRRFGRLSRRRLMEPAIRIAREGFPAGRLLADMSRTYIGDKYRADELDRLLVGPDGKTVEHGETFWEPDLARTLEKIAESGPDAMMTGPVARAIVLAVNSKGGRMSLADLSSIRAHWVEPLRARYRDCDVFAMPPPASGAAVLMALRLFEPVPTQALGPYSATASAALIRAVQESVAAKMLYLGDPEFSRIPLDFFLRGGLRPSEAAPPPEDPEPEDGHTTNVSVIDALGSAVAMTTSVGAPFGSHILVPGTGIVLSNHVADFSPAPNAPNAYGVPYGAANTVEPMKAAVSGATPIVALRGGRALLAIGGSGSARIPPAVTQCFVDVVDYGMTPSEAVAAPRFQVSARSENAWVESRYPQTTRWALRVRGITVEEGVKRASVTAVARRGDLLYGGSDPRKFGVPAGY